MRLHPSSFRLLPFFLWPILWWGYTSAMYCAVEIAPPAPLKLDLSGVSLSAIEKTVEHLQRLVHESEARADTIAQNLDAEQAAHIAAKNDAASLQLVVDTRTRERDQAVERESAWRRRARELMFVAAAAAGAVSLRFLAIVPLPWRYVAAVAIAAAIYAALYLLL